MSDDNSSAPSWVPAYVAFDALRKQYEATNFYADDEVCWRAANDSLLRRLQSGQLRHRASRAHVNSDVEFFSEPHEALEEDADKKVRVPPSFWRYFLDADPIRKMADWLVGDFEFVIRNPDGATSWYSKLEGAVIGLELDAKCLPQSDLARRDPLPEHDPMPQNSARIGGRPPANWWPDFAEELAVYVHENGSPEGQGHDGQSAMIDAIFARMVQHGKAEPGRGTVQPVVNAVLRRIRSAGN